MYLIIGLGNVGGQYENTRHNIGFIAINELVSQLNLQWQKQDKFLADIAVGNITDLARFSNECNAVAPSVKILFCKPNTFMNLSGRAVQKLSSYYKIPVENILVIHDELDIDLGRIKYKQGGGAAGHNGLKSIDQVIGNNYHRLRLGIGRPNNPMAVADYVLSRFAKTEVTAVEDKIVYLIRNLVYFFTDLNKFQQQIKLYK